MLLAVQQGHHNSNHLNIRWRVMPGARLEFRYWGDECVLYHGAAGDTHRLPELVGRLVEALNSGDATTDELSERVDLHEDDVVQALDEMCRLRIAERVA